MNKKKVLLFSVLIFILLVLIAVLLASNFQPIRHKMSNNHFRIGYVNLNQLKISEAELSEYQKFDCDLWLFAEWNGDNLDNYGKFNELYKYIYERVDKHSFGFLVLAKDSLDIIAFEFDSISGPYACDYQKVLIESNSFDLAFLHAPPPVPTCEFETQKYIVDALNHLKKKRKTKNQILIGDFNALPISKSCQMIKEEGYFDIFEESGIFKGSFSGLPGFPKFMRIDYVFIKGGITSKYCARFNLKSSDHCGLLVDLKIEN
ncbi:MAG: endonuclease/exonuclease/phosphatase family protein [Bacteroidetes bacterium]|nr:endonuclease/exonuclease/phosphatase family protein [Bacteroidota bacterium]